MKFIHGSLLLASSSTWLSSSTRLSASPASATGKPFRHNNESGNSSGDQKEWFQHWPERHKYHIFDLCHPDQQILHRFLGPLQIAETEDHNDAPKNVFPSSKKEVKDCIHGILLFLELK